MLKQTMRWGVCVIVLMACGRIGFEAVSADGGDHHGSGDGGIIDGSTAACGGAACAAIGGACNGSGWCVVGSAGMSVTCPAGVTCEFDCTTSGACADVDCSQAVDCILNCSASGACAMGTWSCQDGCTAYCTVGNTCDQLTITGNTTGMQNCAIQCCANNTCINNSIFETCGDSFPGTCP